MINTVSAEQIAHALHGRPSGIGWMARCPAHDDRSPSLSIAERGGKILLHCFAGCTQENVIAGLRARGLWPGQRPYRPSRAECRDRADGPAARWWSLAATTLAEEVLETLGPCDPERAAMTALLDTIRRSPLAEYSKWHLREPTLTRAMVRAGQLYDERIQVLLARFLVEEAA
jgi:hypothetical protein